MTLPFDPPTLESFVYGLEELLGTNHTDIPYPMIYVLIAPQDYHVDEGFKSTIIPIERHQLDLIKRRTRKKRSLGLVDVFVTTFADICNRADRDGLATTFSNVAPGDRVVFCALIMEAWIVDPDLDTSMIFDIERDVKPEHRRDVRTFHAADGNGTAWIITRDRNTWERIENFSGVCRPIDHPGKFDHDGLDTDATMESSILWGLATLTAAYRKHFG